MRGVGSGVGLDGAETGCTGTERTETEGAGMGEGRVNCNGNEEDLCLSSEHMAQSVCAMTLTWMRSDDKWIEVVRLRSWRQWDARNDNEQILVVGRSCRHATR